MKKKIMVMLPVVAIVLCTACSNPAADAADTVIEMNDKVSEVETILDDYKENAESVDAMGESIMEGL